MSIGSRIRDARKQQQLTQAELAQKCGVTKGAISNYENDVSTPDIEKLSIIMECLDVDPNYIYQDYFATSLVSIKSESETFINTPEERSLVEAYRKASPDDQAAVRLILKKYQTETASPAQGVG